MSLASEGSEDHPSLSGNGQGDRLPRAKGDGKGEAEEACGVRLCGGSGFFHPNLDPGGNLPIFGFIEPEDDVSKLERNTRGGDKEDDRGRRDGAVELTETSENLVHKWPGSMARGRRSAGEVLDP